jgi:hypothetical protein
MKIEDITQESLLREQNIRSVDFEHEWYFVAEDLNNMFMGSFQHLSGLPLPIKTGNGREIRRCVSYSDIAEHVRYLKNLSPFERNINTALNYNPRKKQ